MGSQSGCCGTRSTTRNESVTFPTTAERNGDFSGLVNSDGSPVAIYDPMTTCGFAGTPACTNGRSPGRLPFPNNNVNQVYNPATGTWSPDGLGHVGREP